MTLKLSKLPKRTPVKVTSIFPPDVHDALRDYATLYEQTYHSKESIEELVPFIVAAFFEADSTFKKARKSLSSSIPKSTTRPPIKSANEGD